MFRYPFVKKLQILSILKGLTTLLQLKGQVFKRKKEFKLYWGCSPGIGGTEYTVLLQSSNTFFMT